MRTQGERNEQKEHRYTFSGGKYQRSHEEGERKSFCSSFFLYTRFELIHSFTDRDRHSLTQCLDRFLFLIYNYRPQTRSLKTDLIAPLLFSLPHACRCRCCCLPLPLSVLCDCVCFCFVSAFVGNILLPLPYDWIGWEAAGGAAAGIAERASREQIFFWLRRMNGGREEREILTHTSLASAPVSFSIPLLSLSLVPLSCICVYECACVCVLLLKKKIVQQLLPPPSQSSSHSPHRHPRPVICRAAASSSMLSGESHPDVRLFLL